MNVVEVDQTLDWLRREWSGTSSQRMVWGRLKKRREELLGRQATCGAVTRIDGASAQEWIAMRDQAKHRQQQQQQDQINQLNGRYVLQPKWKRSKPT